MRKPNPRSADHAEYTSTHWGIEPDAVLTVEEPDYPPHLVEMGKLTRCQVQLRGHGKTDLRFGGVHEIVTHVRSRSKRIYIVTSAQAQRQLRARLGGDGWDVLGDIARDVGGRQAQFRYPRISVLPLGRLLRLDYLTHKEGDGPSEYTHRMGEEGGIEPELCMDDRGRLWVAGGSYSVRAAGIVH